MSIRSRHLTVMSRPTTHCCPSAGPRAALLHVYEELAQHGGQLEVTADVLRG
jgi:hypothetical protein